VLSFVTRGLASLTCIMVAYQTQEPRDEPTMLGKATLRNLQQRPRAESSWYHGECVTLNNPESLPMHGEASSPSTCILLVS
jgi:hypothetical protein